MTPTQVRALPGWSDAVDGEISSLIQMCAERWHRVGAVVIDGSKAAPGAMMVVSGELQATIEVGDMALPVHTLGPGAWIGTLSALDEGVEMLSLRATSEARVLLVGREGMERLRTHPSPLSLRIHRGMVKTMQALQGKVSPLVAQVQRLAAERRKHTRADLLAIGFARLTQSAQQASRDGPAGRTVEVVQHEGVPVAANFRALR